jgi:hypothetical protein
MDTPNGRNRILGIVARPPADPADGPPAPSRSAADPAGVEPDVHLALHFRGRRWGPEVRPGEPPRPGAETTPEPGRPLSAVEAVALAAVRAEPGLSAEELHLRISRRPRLRCRLGTVARALARLRSLGLVHRPEQGCGYHPCG